MQEIALERGGRRRKKGTEACFPGHMVKNHMTVIVLRWRAMEGYLEK